MRQTSDPSLDGNCSHEQTCDLESLVALAKDAGSTLTHLTALLIVNWRAHSPAPVRALSLSALRNFPLQHLHVRERLVDWLVMYLARLCPNLQSFEIACYMIMQGDGRWKPVPTETIKQAFFLRQKQLHTVSM